jgi:hypothetical protein
MRYVITLCWGACFVQVGILFLIGQLLVTNSLMSRMLTNLDRPLQAFGQGLMVWLEGHPEISVRATQNLLFYFFSTQLLTFSLVAIALALPHLITRDLSSNAIIIYSHKAIGRFDYLLGKFAALFGLLCLTWLGPVCTAWFLGNLLAPHWHFFWHSRLALGNTLVYVLSSMTILSLLGLGVSAISEREKAAVGLWFGLWLIGNALVPLARQTKPWLKFCSFGFDLRQISVAVFRLKNDLDLVKENIPVFGQLLRGVRRQTLMALQSPELAGAMIGLSVMLLVAALILAWRVRPE